MAVLASCPKCHKPMDAYATICPHCGYDFPPDDPVAQILPEKRYRQGIAQGWFGDAILVIASVIFLLAGIVCLAGAVYMAFSKSWPGALSLLGSAFWSMVMYVVVQRALDRP